MKYSLITCQPRSKASSTVVMMSCSLMFLLITSRSRWVPASAAMVTPVLRTRLIRSIIRELKVPARSEGNETATRCAWQRAIRCSISWARQW